MEWDSGVADMKFFHAFSSLPQVENSVIEYDVKNVHKVMSKKCQLSGDTVAKRLNVHYRDSLRHIRRSYGNKQVDDFQRYTWGLVVTIDLGLEVDKLEFLIQIYSKKVYPRLIKSEYEKILTTHTSFRKIKDKGQKRVKWRELKASWTIHAIKLPECPPTVSKNHFLNILDVNGLKFDIDVEYITRDLQAADVEANRLHMLLLDDPVINGEYRPKSPITKSQRSKTPERATTPSKRRSMVDRPTFTQDALNKLTQIKIKKDNLDKLRMEKFEASVTEEEKKYGEIMREQAEAAMRREFETKQALMESRRQQRRAKKEAEAAFLIAEKNANIERVKEIRQQRELQNRSDDDIKDSQPLEEAPPLSSTEKVRVPLDTDGTSDKDVSCMPKDESNGGQI